MYNNNTKIEIKSTIERVAEFKIRCPFQISASFPNKGAK
jgi:hypothetical protein